MFMTYFAKDSKRIPRWITIIAKKFTVLERQHRGLFPFRCARGDRVSFTDEDDGGIRRSPAERSVMTGSLSTRESPASRLATGAFDQVRALATGVSHFRRCCLHRCCQTTSETDPLATRRIDPLEVGRRAGAEPQA